MDAAITYAGVSNIGVINQLGGTVKRPDDDELVCHLHVIAPILIRN